MQVILDDFVMVGALWSNAITGIRSQAAIETTGIISNLRISAGLMMAQIWFGTL
jgi:hypothetical protein